MTNTEVEQFWEDSLKRRAFAEGRDAYKTGAANPYVDQTARIAWREGFDEAKRTAHKCERCEEEDITPVIEAFELSGQVVCEDCAEEVFQENS